MIVRVILAWIYRATFQAFFNIVFNLYHLCKIVLSGNYKKARYKLSIARADVYRGAMPLLVYRYDGITDKANTLGMWPCWTALPIVFAGMDMSGNCMDAAYFYKRTLKGKVRVWIPDGKKWYRRIHYVFQRSNGCVYSFTQSGMHRHKSLEDCRPGGRWI